MQPSDSSYGGAAEDDHVVPQMPQDLPDMGNLAQYIRYLELLPSSEERIGYVSDLDFHMPVECSQRVHAVVDLTELASVEDDQEAELNPVQM